MSCWLIINTDKNTDVPACIGCGRCCHLVVVLDEATDHVPPEYAVEREGVWCMDQEGDGACVALDRATKRCTIYDIRPQVCRDFTRGELLCRTILNLPAQ